MKDSNTIDDTLLIPVMEPGGKLYHYTSATGLKGICEGSFWVTEHGFLNDSMEFQVATDVFDEILEKHMNNKDLCRHIKEKVRAEVNRSQQPGLSTTDSIAYGGDYVISFCKDYDSPLMWSAYSDYTGYCIQFDFDKLLNDLSMDETTGLLHGEVVYNREEQIHLIEETITRSYFNWNKGFEYLKTWDDLDKLTESNIDDWKKYIGLELTAYNMFFKLPCFEGEHEYRFVFMLGHDGGRYKPEQLWKQHFRVKDEVLIPFIKVPLKSIDSIERVLVGAKNKSDIALKGVQYFFRNLKHDTIVEKSQMPLRY